MKKKLIAIILILAALTALTSCIIVTTRDTTSLAGTWYTNYSNYVYRLVLNSSGSGYLDNYTMGNHLSTFTWYTLNSRIYINEYKGYSAFNSSSYPYELVSGYLVFGGRTYRKYR